MKKIDQEEFVKLYKTLPPRLQSALFSEEIGNNVEKICRRYEITQFSAYKCDQSNSIRTFTD